MITVQHTFYARANLPHRALSLLLIFTVLKFGEQNSSQGPQKFHYGTHHYLNFITAKPLTEKNFNLVPARTTLLLIRKPM